MKKTATPPTKKISRRDALKLLTAVTGAAALANLPPAWSKPDLKVGVLPAHAQTSMLHTLACDPNANTDDNVEQPDITVTSRVTINPIGSGIPMRYTVVLVQTEPQPSGEIISPDPLSNTTSTNTSGIASLDVIYRNVWRGATITINWSFENASDGTGTCAQIFSTPPDIN